MPREKCFNQVHDNQLHPDLHVSSQHFVDKKYTKKSMHGNVHAQKVSNF